MKITFKLLVRFFSIGLIGLMVFSCSEKKPSNIQAIQNTKVHQVTLGLALQPSGSLFFIAEKKGYFKKNNLELKIIEYPSGKRALKDGLLKNKVDLITTTEVPFVFSSFEYEELRIISSIFLADNVNSVIARRDSGVAKPEDLVGKRVATQKASAVHYFLNLFLLENDLDENDIIPSYMKAENLPRALSEGRIDAFSMREPYISEARNLLGENAIIFKEPGIYNQVELLVAKESFIESNPAVIYSILKALKEAEVFFVEHPMESDAIVSERLGVDINVASAFRAEMKQRVSLDQSMLLLLEGIGRWAIGTKMVERKLPNYLKYIHYSTLSEIDNKSVTIIH